MTARTIVGLCTIAGLVGVTLYLLLQIPWEYGVGGIVALIGILWALAIDAPDQL
jgi:hypothetical protein